MNTKPTNSEVFTVWMPDYSAKWHVLSDMTSVAGKNKFHKKAEELSGISDYCWERAIAYDEAKVISA